MKSLLRSRPVQWLLSDLLRRYLWLVIHTTRWTLEGAPNLAPHAAGAPAIFGFWHEFLPLMPAVAIMARRDPGYRRTPLYALVSQSRDGRFIGAIVARFGITPVHGSSSRGAAASSRRLLKLLQEGGIVCISPDGPRGPRREAASGLAQLAALASVPIMPCAARTERGIALNTWDRMVIPLPFGRGRVVCEPPIHVQRDAWREAMPRISAGINAAAASAGKAE